MPINNNKEQYTLQATLDGKGPYVVTEFTVDEKISGKSTFSATLFSEKIISEKVLGKTLAFKYTSEFSGRDKISREFVALISSIEKMEHQLNKNLYMYHVEAIDPLSIFAYRTTSRCFQELTSKQILEKVFSDSGLKSYFSLSPRSAGIKHTYCIQFNETDLNFINRIMASEGWHYHCDHTGKNPSIIIADSNQNFAKSDYYKIPFIHTTKDKTFSISQWDSRSNISSSKLLLVDHSEELAECLDSGERKSSSTIINTELSDYFFGQGYADKSNMRDAVKRQMESQDCRKNIIYSNAAIPSLGAGLRFALVEHDNAEYNQEYLITEASHHFKGTAAGSQIEYSNTFQCIAASTPWRPLYINKPSINNIQCAEVTGPKGEEVNQDKLGRIKVRFHWDKDTKKDENSSCWIPVSQATASNGFGAQFIPRIGDEVLVSFIDGDPDRPVVSGSIYNGKNKPPYSSPTQSGLKTRSTPKGNANTANELRFEDKKDKEEVFLQAEKDLTINVKDELNQNVAGKFQFEGDDTVNWASKKAMNLISDDTFTAKAKKDLNLTSNATINCQADKNAEITATSKVLIDGKSIALTGQSKIKLSVGSSSIELSPSGIKIAGAQISIKGQAKVEVGAAMVDIASQASTTIKGTMIEVNASAMTNVKAGAMVEIKGAITKVN